MHKCYISINKRLLHCLMCNISEVTVAWFTGFCNRPCSIIILIFNQWSIAFILSSIQTKA